MKIARDIACVIGAALTVGGVATFDWRFALVIAGLLVCAGALLGMARDDR